MDIKNKNRFTNIILNKKGYHYYNEHFVIDRYKNFYNCMKQYYYHDLDNNILKLNDYNMSFTPRYILEVQKIFSSSMKQMLETFKDQCLDYEKASSWILKTKIQ